MDVLATQNSEEKWGFSMYLKTSIKTVMCLILLSTHFMAAVFPILAISVFEEYESQTNTDKYILTNPAMLVVKILKYFHEKYLIERSCSKPLNPAKTFLSF